MICNDCRKRDKCIKICDDVSAMLKDLEVKQKHTLECYVSLDNRIIKDSDYPEPEIILNIEDWRVFIDKYKPTETQAKYLYGRYWNGMTYKAIGEMYGVSLQAVEQTIKRFLGKYKSCKLR